MFNVHKAKYHINLLKDLEQVMRICILKDKLDIQFQLTPHNKLQDKPHKLLDQQQLFLINNS